MLDQIRERYESYEAEFRRLEQERRAGAGMFGLTNGPRNYPCHEQFAKDLERLLQEAASLGLSSEEAAGILEYVYFVSQAREEVQDAIYWMQIAVHGMTEGLITRLTPEAAGSLLARYETVYPRRNRMPVQIKVISALKKRVKARP